MLTCEQVHGQLGDYMDGTLDTTHLVPLVAHLDACKECRNEVLALRKTIELVRSVPTPPSFTAREAALTRLRAGTLPVNNSRHVLRPQLLMRTMKVAVIAATIIVAVNMRSIVLPVGESHLQAGPPIIAMAIESRGLPSSNELDEMVSLHAIHSLSVTRGDTGMEQEALADANSRLSLKGP